MEPSGARSAVRLGLRMIIGFPKKSAEQSVGSRDSLPFKSTVDMWRRADIPVTMLVRLAEADAFLAAFGVSRRDALWRGVGE